MILNKRVPISFRFNEIKQELIIVICITVICDFLPDVYMKIDKLPDIPISIAAILGTAISILLSFRVNQSFGWWWEARQIWGSIINDSRNFTLQLQLYVKNDPETVKRVALRQAAWAYALAQSLRKQDPFKHTEELLAKADREKLSQQQHVPLAILAVQNEELKTLHQQNKINDFGLNLMSETLQRFTDALGKCERIKNTVFPRMSADALHATIYLFAIFLSMPLKLNLVLEVIIITTITMVFFILEKSAKRLQTPFENLPNDIPMHALSITIETNIKQLLHEENLPKPAVAELFYAL